MENNMMIIIWRDILVAFVLSILARMVSGKEKFTIKCVGKPANSHLWRVNKNPPSYLFGTIHYPWDILWKDPNHIHKNVKYAFKKSHSIYTELDFHNLTTLDVLQKCRFLPGNLTLKKVLPRDLMFRLKKHLAYVRRTLQGWLHKDHETTYQKVINAHLLYNSITKNWEKKRPVWIVILIMLELTPSSVRRQHQEMILDLFLTNFGKRRGKSTGGLETAEDQCDPFNNINNRQAIFLLNYTLHLQELIRNGKMMPEHESEQDKILKVYLCGNLEKGIVAGSNRLLVNSNAKDHVAESQVKKIIEIEEYLMNQLVFKRNMKMARRINELLTTNKTLTFFFAIGTGHLSGKSSVVELLQNKGYQIDHIKPEDYLSGQKKWEKRRARRKIIRKRNKKRKQQGYGQQRQQWTRFDLFFRGTRRTTVAMKTKKVTPTVSWNDVPVVQPKEIPNNNKVSVRKQQNYVYYYTNAKPRTIGNLQTLMFCWLFGYFICQLVT